MGFAHDGCSGALRSRFYLYRWHSSGTFTGNGTGTGIKANAMPLVMADYYNRTLKRRGEVNTFSIVKFRKKTNGTVNTEEHGFPNIKTDQPWIGEAPVGDWFYAPNFTYDSGMMIRYLLKPLHAMAMPHYCFPSRWIVG
jgi:alpha-L-fucosidase